MPVIDGTPSFAVEPIDGLVDQAGVHVESDTYNVTRGDRVARVTEGLRILRRLWTENDVTFEGKHYNFRGVSIEPKPVNPAGPPIWLAVHPPAENRDAVEKAHRRIVKYTDGWQTSKWAVDDLEWRIVDLGEKSAAAGKSIETHLYHNVNLTDDLDQATAESKKFLDLYYTTDYTDAHVRGWVAKGTTEQIVEKIRSYERIGFDGITFRITSWNQKEQLNRFINEVLPHFA